MVEPEEDGNEPFFHIHYVNDELAENGRGYWAQYDVKNKSWFRICDKCLEKVREPSEAFCVFHLQQKKKRIKKSIPKIKNVKKKSKRLDTKPKTKSRKRKTPLEAIFDNKIEQIDTEQSETFREPLGIVISVSSSLNKQQISQVRQFIAQFNNESQSIQLTCESQPDYIDDTTTHLITNDTGFYTTLITKQIVQACVRHIFVSSINWITESLNQSSIVDHFPYEILRDKYAFKNSRGIKQCRFDSLPVFPSSYIISVECQKGLKEMKMTREELVEIVELSGATLLNDYVQYNTLIILCNSKSEASSKKKQNDENLQMINEKKFYYCQPEYLFDSIVRHEVQAIEKYVW